MESSGAVRPIPLARALMGGLFLIAAGVSVVASLPFTISVLVDEHRSAVQLTQAQRATDWTTHAPLPRAVIVFFRDHVRPGQRFYVQAHGPGNTVGSAHAVAGYALLPSVMVSSPARADVVVSFRADPRQLALRYTRVVQFSPGISVATVARGR